MKSIKTRSLISIFLLLGSSGFHVGCGAAQANPHNTTTLHPEDDQILPGDDLPETPSKTDVRVVPVDAVVLGLPEPSEDVGVAPEASSPILVSQGGENGEIVAPIRQGERAPFNGVIFNGPAVARIAVAFEEQQNRCVIERAHDRSLFEARYNLDIASLQLALTTQQQTDQILLDSRNRDITALNETVNQQNRAINGPHIGEGLLWASGGLLLGTAIFGGVLLWTTLHP